MMDEVRKHNRYPPNVFHDCKKMYNKLHHIMTVRECITKLLSNWKTQFEYDVENHKVKIHRSEYDVVHHGETAGYFY